MMMQVQLLQLSNLLKFEHQGLSEGWTKDLQRNGLAMTWQQFSSNLGYQLFEELFDCDFERHFGIARIAIELHNFVPNVPNYL